MEVVLYQRDFKRLTELETKFGKDQKLTEEAEVRLYDRYITVRTSILIQMRNVAWAYKFAVLDNEPIQIDPLKNVQDYRKDLSDLDYTGFDTKIIPSQNVSCLLVYLIGLPRFNPTDISNYRPRTTPKSLSSSKPLIKALSPLSQNPRKHTITVQLISTTGVYNDIRKLDIFTFVGHVFSREYSYNIVEGKPVMDTAFTINTNEYSAPPPFTTWTVEITNPGSLDLSGLTSMNLQWHGQKYNEEFLG
ncbi:hypothetical protein CA14_001367 [Aspergillus flavus]|uniref:Uncharacterized protein n=1 Tax=Aspergillus flavus TaxID=5059 RepID=A0AB74C3Q7_ASPFL|nr:hypothetical protein CA14_001367 [Aspergillus flavus]